MPDYNATFYPDGKKIAFTTGIGGGGRNKHPIFSPDGQWIVFTSQRAGFSAETGQDDFVIFVEC